MDIQSAVLNQLFVLFPVIIQGWITPVKPADIAHGGIPQVLYDGQLQGLECLIDPWPELQLQSWTMAVDDRVDLYINDDPTPVAGVTIQPGEEALRQRLYIPHGYLKQGVNRLHYKVFRVGGNTSEDSRDLLVLYHLRTPDNLDLVIPPDVINEGVSAERAAQGVEFRFFYNNRRPYDRIRLRIGDTEVTFDVPDGNAPITHTLFTDAFRAAGDNSSAVVDFIVTDQLGNPTKSPEKRLDIHLEAETFDSPILRERVNDPGDDKTEIDLEKLGGDPLLVIVLTSDLRMLLGDLIYVTYICKVTGQPDVVVTPPAGTVEADEFGQRKLCIVEVPNEHVIPDGAVTVAYKVHRANDDAVGSSRVARAQVIGEALPAAMLEFTNGPYEVLAGKTFDVGLLLTRDGVPQEDVVVTLRLASEFEFPGGGGGERDFITDAKGVVTVTGIIASGTEGAHELVAKSKGANDAVARVEVLAEGPVGYIDVGEPQYNIVMTNNGKFAFVETTEKILKIDIQTNHVIASIEKNHAVIFYKMLITPDDNKIYAHVRDGKLYVIDLLSLKITKTITDNNRDIDLSSDGSHLATISSNHPAVVSIIESITETVMRTFPAGNSAEMLFSKDRARLYYIDSPPNSILNIVAINPETGSLIRSATYNDRGGQTFIFSSTNGNHIYISFTITQSTPYSNRIIEFAADSLVPLRTFNFPAALRIATILPNYLLLKNETSTSVTILNLATGNIDGSIEIGHTGLPKMAYTLDHKRLFACNQTSRLLTVIALP